jgi:hypothetical protein
MAAGLLLWFCGCAANSKSSAKVYAPDDMPDVCQELDFNHNVSLREICGVKTRNYMAYRNIPEHRNLLMPKGGRIVKKGKSLELRLQSTLPAPLPEDFQGKILFDEKFRRNFLKSRMDYWEFFPDSSSQHVKIIKLDIPMDTGGEKSVCFTVQSKSSSTHRKAGYASSLDPLDCSDFLRLKAAPAGDKPGEMDQPIDDAGQNDR